MFPRLIIFLLLTSLWMSAAHAADSTSSVVLSEHFVSSNHRTFVSGTSAEWYGSATIRTGDDDKFAYAKGIDADNGSLAIGAGSRTAVGYFTPAASPVTLAAGETLVVEFTFTISGTPLDKANSIAFALMQSDTRVTTDFGSSAPANHVFANYTGYAAFANLAGGSSALSLRRRATGADALLSSPSTWTALATTGVTPKTSGPITSAGRPQNVEESEIHALLVFARDTAGVLEFSCVLTQGERTLADFTVADADAAAASHAPLNFDTLAVFVASNSLDAGAQNPMISLRQIDIAHTVVTPPAAPQIIAQPASQTVLKNRTAILEVIATGNPAPACQWLKNGAPIPGANSTTLLIENAAAADAADYSAVLTNTTNGTLNTVTTGTARLTVNLAIQPPAIVTAPRSQAIPAGAAAVLTVLVASDPDAPAPTYQWTRNGSPISGATSATLILGNVQSETAAATDNTANPAGTYAVTITNTGGSTSTAAAPAIITIDANPPRDYYVAPNAPYNGAGTLESPVAFTRALTLVKPGGTIYMRGGKYSYAAHINIERSNSGTGEFARKKIFAYVAPDGTEEIPILDFSLEPRGDTDAGFSNERGLQIIGSWWHMRGIIIQNSADNGLYLCGNHNIIERVITRWNGDSGLQLSRMGNSEDINDWPAYNLILNCTSHDNDDRLTNSGEDGDGFGAKMTVGVGNVFRGCIAHHNMDDGFDFYNVPKHPPTGPIVVDRCIAYVNGMLSDGFRHPNGDGNGFKLGGENQSVAHIITRCIAFDNTQSGFVWNSNPGAMLMLNNLTFDNSRQNFKMDSPNAVHYNNVSLYTGKTLPKWTDAPDDLVSNDRCGTKLNSSGYGTGPSNVLWYPSATAQGRGPSVNDNNITVSPADFATLTPPVAGFARHADGSIDFGDFARLKPASRLINSGVFPPTFQLDKLTYDWSAYYDTAPDIGPRELAALGAPLITAQPASQTLIAGAAAHLSVALAQNADTPRCTFQWYKNNSPVEGATAASLTLVNLRAADAGSYHVIINNPHDDAPVHSAAATLTVLPAGTQPPEILMQPSSQIRIAGNGNTATFTVTLAPNPANSLFPYQWYKNDTPIPGATTATLTLANLTETDAGNYHVTILNTRSATATFTVLPAGSTPPVITAQLPATSGARTFTAAISGSPVATIRWQRSLDGGATWEGILDNADYSGAATTTLTITNVPAGAEVCRYRYIATNALGTVTSAATVSIFQYIRTQPANQTVTVGKNFSLLADLNITTPDTAIQWQVSSGTGSGATWANLSNNARYDGVATALLDIRDATADMDGLRYRYEVTAPLPLTSNVSRLTVTPTYFVSPASLTLDERGNLYVVDDVRRVLQRITPARQIEILTSETAPVFKKPSAVRYETGDAILLVADSGTLYRVIVSTTTSGTVTRSLTNVAAIPNTEPNLALSVIDAHGNSYRNDAAAHVIRRTMRAGVTTVLAGLENTAGRMDGVGHYALFNNPTGMTIDTSGTLYVADKNNSAIRIIAPDSATVTTLLVSPLPEPPPETTGTTSGTTSGSGGGGGATTIWFIAALGTLIWLRRFSAS